MLSIIKTAIIIALTAIAVKIYPVVFISKLKYEFGGTVEPGFENLKEVFKQNFANDWDFEGAAYSVCHKGKIVADLWGGYADSEAHRIWQKDTMTTLFSTTKAISALCLAMLVDRGMVKYSDLVTKHWPEFGQNGKEKITVKMLASHEAGLAVLDEPVTFGLVRDWRKMSAAFEKQKPNWEIGTGAGYHTFTYGWIIDQLLRRVDTKKRSLGQFFREEVAEPHNLDIYIGLPLELEYRVARIIQPRMFREMLSNLLDLKFWSDLLDWKVLKAMYTMFMMPADSLFNRAFNNPDWLSKPPERLLEMSIFANLFQDNFMFNNPELHALEIGAANGIGTARSLAQLFCLVDSGQILNKSTVEQLMKPVYTYTPDIVINMNLTWGWGFWHTKNPDGQFQIGHPGYGAQFVKYDPQYHLSFAYIRNGLAFDFDIANVKPFKALENISYDIIRNK